MSITVVALSPHGQISNVTESVNILCYQINRTVEYTWLLQQEASITDESCPEIESVVRRSNRQELEALQKQYFSAPNIRKIKRTLLTQCFKTFHSDEGDHLISDKYM